MKIIIAGAGAVGTHLSKLLSSEKQDIILMDEDASKFQGLSQFDLMTAAVSPTSIKGLKEVGAAHADLFIGVTPDESKNMTCCMLAKAMGAKKTVARINNAEYLDPQHVEFFQKMGINSLIYPEALAAQELVDGTRMSWVRQWWEVHGGALIMLGVKMRETAEILDIPLRELCAPGAPYHVVAIKRGDETLIPSGNDELKLYDIVYFMTTKKYIPYIRKICGKEQYSDVRNVIIMGGGRTAMHTAMMLPDYMHITIFEKDEARCERLSRILDEKHVVVVNGDGRDLQQLQDEGLEETEAFLALTNSAEANVLACLTAKRLGVSKTAAMVENMDYVSMAEHLDIGTVINKKTVAASHIYRMMLKADVSNVKCLMLANADVAEFVVREGAKITRKPVKDVGLPRGVNIGGVVRNGEGFLVSGDSHIQAGDHVVVFCMQMMIKKIEKYFY